MTVCINSHGAQRFTWRHRSSASAVVTSKGSYPFVAALFTSMSIGPSSASTRPTRSLRPPAGSERSHGTTNAWPPRASMRRLVFSRPSMVRAVTATLAPSAARRMAIAVPVPPWLAPVTRATWPSQFRSGITLSLSGWRVESVSRSQHRYGGIGVRAPVDGPLILPARFPALAVA